MQDIVVAHRSLLRLTGAGVIGAAAMTGGCAAGGQRAAGATPRSSATPGRRPEVLLAYFSCAGWNYHDGGRKYLQTGNTQRLADMIGELTGCDVHCIEAAEPYSRRL